MAENEAEIIRARIDKLRYLTNDHQGSQEWTEAGALALTTLYDTVGGKHPLASVLETASKADLGYRSCAPSRKTRCLVKISSGVWAHVFGAPLSDKEIHRLRDDYAKNHTENEAER